MNTYAATINYKKFTIQANSIPEAVMKLENLTGIHRSSFAHTVKRI